MTISPRNTAVPLQPMEPDLPKTLPSTVLPTLPCNLPVSRFGDSVDIESIANPLVQSLASLSTDVLSAEPVWRDIFALTGTLRTIYSARTIVAGWSDTCGIRQAHDFHLIPGSGRVSRPDQNTAWLHVGFRFRVTAVPAAECHGFLALVLEEDGQWRIWTIRTVLEQLVGCRNVNILPEVTDNKNDISNSLNLMYNRASLAKGADHDSSTPDYDVIIAGAGQAGLSTAGRLQALEVDYLVLEAHHQVGENWAIRYDSAKLHTPRDYSQLPFGRIFSSSYQEYLNKHDLVKGYKDFIHRYSIEKNIQWSTTLNGGSWDAARKLWTLQVTRSGKEEILTCRHIVIAVGSGGQTPIMPTLPGQEDFQGEVLHSVDYRSADSWKGQKAIVVGTANTAHDVASDMVDAGLKSITMVQRSRTYVLPAEYFKAISDRTYDGKVEIEDADREQYSQPLGISRLLSMKSLHAMASKEPERFDALERVGFKVERYGDIVYQLTEKMGGHYIDVGCSEKIAKGLIQIKSNALASHFTRTGLMFSDGTEIPADVIVFCTGFRGNMRTNVQELFGKEIAAQVDDFWTLDAEGELKGAFKPTGQFIKAQQSKD
ncbi:hypothetical protein EYZ11_011409 [Aspergillus tanneri]|uniref:FAD/NAD(P)-binding domain-containing protein n=1 Tax=Aspergillus tanneri TaxID=1220188 RepID=A0A4S3J3H9_9EURO|nr:uncharacterized protein ATNIH1004_005462 [Aspergillus tanneri]KAA8646787.1 hypothetical protein ATNIH1004_005462 [Aspergillus tanneri]THC89142.1 hypothetical protein EYZ11_011409 [Aspergillus tanneri]